MNELFYDNGHLSDEALKMLISGESLSELERLEISEHLAFCDTCIAKYAEMLEENVLLAPIESVAPTVMQRIKQRARKVFANKYAAVVAAACFTLVFWNLGVFNINITSNNGKVLKQLNHEVFSFSEKTQEVSMQLCNSLDQFMSSFSIERGLRHDEKK